MLDHLLAEAEKENKNAPAQDSLSKITTFAKVYIKKSIELKELEDRVNEKKAECTKYSQELIPQAMLEVNMTSFKLDTGETIAFQEDVNCTVKDADKLYDFLDERGDGNLMKISLEIGKVPKNILAMIVKTINDKFGIMSEAKLVIHPMTLKSYVKSMCGVGGKTECELPLSDIDEEMIGTFTYYKTTVK